MFKLIFIILILTTRNLYPIEIICNFEEVYQNKEIQEGNILIKESLMRYEYLDKKLYTVIKQDENFYLVNNVQHENYQKITDNIDLLNQISIIFEDLPNIENFYTNDDFDLKIEKSNKTNFIKRISVNSENLNMSIYFYNCEKKKLDNKLFKHKPFFKNS